jgi:hypothetical protein
MLHVMQWVGFVGECLSPVILWLKGRWQLFGALFFLGFHAANTAILLIHFLPTVVCWLAFAPLERIVPWFRSQTGAVGRGRNRRQPSAGDAGQAEHQTEDGGKAKEQAGA